MNTDSEQSAPHRGRDDNRQQRPPDRPGEPPDRITHWLEQAAGGEQQALDRLLAVLYSELRSRAVAFMRKERQHHTLQPTALVHEAYLRLVDQSRVSCENRSQFLAFAAQTMRRILVEHARARNADKRGGSRKRVPLQTGILSSVEPDVDVLALEDALGRLRVYDPRLSQVVELRFFGGLSVKEVAEVLQVDARTINRDWKMARTILFDELQNQDA